MYYRWDQDALYLDCSIQPGANHDEIVGPVGEQLKIRISAAATDGKANKRLIRFLSKLFRTKQVAITIVRGQTGRHKRLRIMKPLIVPDELEISTAGG
ncbi:MAG: DUF167 family protein [Pseudohongiellaceae bacterium]